MGIISFVVGRKLTFYLAQGYFRAGSALEAWN